VLFLASACRAQVPASQTPAGMGCRPGTKLTSWLYDNNGRKPTMVRDLQNCRERVRSENSLDSVFFLTNLFVTRQLGARCRFVLRVRHYETTVQPARSCTWLLACIHSMTAGATSPQVHKGNRRCSQVGHVLNSRPPKCPVHIYICIYFCHMTRLGPMFRADCPLLCRCA